tara:strand:- start:38 stop:220 length:183 start_codon:yes stop_codon:yes gene_type:complete
MAYPTNPIYKLLKDPSTNTQNVVLKNVNGIEWNIPFVTDNTDYQEYLKWKAEGNEPEAAD